MKSISDLIIILGTMPFEIWLVLVAFSIIEIRMHLSDIMFGSFAKYTKSSRKKSNAATKEQPLWRRITMTYIGDYVTKELRAGYKLLMVLKVVIDTATVLGTLIYAVGKFVEIPFAVPVLGVIMLVLVIILAFLVLMYNPNAKVSRFIG